MVVESIPEGYLLDFEESLFNRHTHRLLQSNEGWSSFYFLSEKKGMVLASWHLKCDLNTAHSPFRATFGGIDMSDKLGIKELDMFINQVEEKLISVGMSKLQIVLPPIHYNENKLVLVNQCLADNNYKILNMKTASTIKVDNPSFEEKLHESEIKRLKKCVDFSVERLTINEFDKVYTFLSSCREEKGHQLSMTREALFDVVQSHPDDFVIYGVYDNQHLIAAAICIRVISDVLYVFYGGHAKSYDQYSPAVLLYKGIYNHCFANHYRLLDLGTSALEDGTDHNLLKFKTNIGGDPNLKISYTKDL